MSILSVIINTHTSAGYAVLPFNSANTVSGLVMFENNTYINATPSSSSQIHIRSNLANETNTSAGSLGNTAAILSSLGGLAFIPSAFGLMIETMQRIPGTLLAILNTLATLPQQSSQSGAITAVTAFCIIILSGALMSYYVIIFALKLVSPVLKTEAEDV